MLSSCLCHMEALEDTTAQGRVVTHRLVEAHLEAIVGLDELFNVSDDCGFIATHAYCDRASCLHLCSSGRRPNLKYCSLH